MAPTVAPFPPSSSPDGDIGSLVDLERLACQLAAGLGQRRPVPIPTTGRRWTRLLEQPDHNAWLIAWAPGSGLALHDHGEASAAITVIGGHLRERFTNRLVDGYRRRTLVPGDTVSFGSDHVHEIVNHGVEPAFSVHVYTPGLEQVTFV